MTTGTVFTDDKERVWNLRMVYGDVKRVRSMLGINLVQAGGNFSTEELASMPEEKHPIYVRLLNDPILLVDVVYALVQPQAVQQEVSSEDFGAAITPKVFKEMSEIFWSVYHDFFESSGDKIRAKVVGSILKMVERAGKNLDAMDVQIEEAMNNLDEEMKITLQKSTS